MAYPMYCREIAKQRADLRDKERYLRGALANVEEQLKRTPSCGYSEPASAYRDPDTGKHRTARCEGGGRIVVRGNGLDSVTDGTIFIDARPCPACNQQEL